MQSQNHNAFAGMETFFKVFNRACLAITLWLTVITIAKDDKDNSVSNPDSSGVGVLQGLESVLQNSQNNLESTSTHEDLGSNSFESTSFRHESRSKSYESRSTQDSDSSGDGELLRLESVLQNSKSNRESTSTQEDLSSKSYESRSFQHESRSKSYESRSDQHESRSRSDEPISFGDLLDSMDNDQDNSNDYNDLPNKGRI